MKIRRRIQAAQDYAGHVRDVVPLDRALATMRERWESPTPLEKSTAAAARRHVPALHAALLKQTAWLDGDSNADIGGGPYDDATDALAAVGIRNIVFDPYNRDPDHNTEALRLFGEAICTSAIVSNVLNVVDTPEARSEVIRLAASTGGICWFSIYEGDKSGVGVATRDGWQSNRTLASYVPEVEAHFLSVRLVTLGSVRAIEAVMPSWASTADDAGVAGAITLGSLAADPLNPRDMTSEARAGLAASMDAFGDLAGLVWNKRTGHLVSGHQRVTELRARYGDDLALIDGAFRAGGEVWPVRIVDWPADKARAALMAANSELISGDWTDGAFDLLEDLDDDMDDLLESLRLDELADELEPSGGRGGGSDPDDAPDPPAKAVSRPGEVYILGPHRVICGDATDPHVFDALMAGDGGAHLVWTDPPYGIHVIGGAREQPREHRKGLTLDNDLTTEQVDVLLGAAVPLMLARCLPGAHIYVCAPPSPPQLEPFIRHLNAAGVLRQSLVWLKNRFVLSQVDFHYRHELILYGWHPGAARLSPNEKDRTLDTIIEADSPAKSQGHPTQKPVVLIVRCLQPSSRSGDIVLDPFGGSGSTLMACAETGRRARLIEIDPKYCDVVRRRWTAWAIEAGVEPGPGALDG